MYLTGEKDPYGSKGVLRHYNYGWDTKLDERVVDVGYYYSGLPMWDYFEIIWILFVNILPLFPPTLSFEL